MAALLPYLLLCSTIAVRYLLARRNPWGWRLDLLTVAPWIALYAGAGLWPLIPIPVLFGALDLMALRRWWR